MAGRFPRGHDATKKLIASCAANGAGIEGLPDAPSFRFIPVAQAERPLEYGPPSARGTVACGKSKPKGIRNWNPVRLSLDPNYQLPMAGDHPDLTEARKAWAKGDPKPLREWLAEDAAIRMSHQLWERKDVAA
jgi:hypothetical protein